MNLTATLVLAFGMSMDAFAASIGKGAALDRPRFAEAIRTGAIFGLSAFSLWEVGKKVQKGKLVLPSDLPGWFDAVLTNITVLPLTPSIIAEAMRLPEFPNGDPGDEFCQTRGVSRRRTRKAPIHRQSQTGSPIA